MSNMTLMAIRSTTTAAIEPRAKYRVLYVIGVASCAGASACPVGDSAVAAACPTLVSPERLPMGSMPESWGSLALASASRRDPLAGLTSDGSTRLAGRERCTLLERLPVSMRSGGGSLTRAIAEDSASIVVTGSLPADSGSVVSL